MQSAGINKENTYLHFWKENDNQEYRMSVSDLEKRFALWMMYKDPEIVSANKNDIIKLFVLESLESVTDDDTTNELAMYLNRIKIKMFKELGV